jgi:hypothetical protein
MVTPNVSLAGALITKPRTYIPSSAYRHIMNKDGEAQGHVCDSGVVRGIIVEDSRAAMRITVDLYS